MNNHKQRFGDSESTKWVLFDYLIPGGIGIWKCWFLSRGETGVCSKKPLGAGERTNKKLQTNIWYQFWDLNPGHIAGKRVLSPLHHPCAHNNVQNNSYLQDMITLKGHYVSDSKNSLQTDMCLHLITDHYQSIPSPSIIPNKKH